jgi:hypothetical protein
VLDGAISARVLARLEDTLNGPIAQELRGSQELIAPQQGAPA